jgi:hypothetical protein
MLKVPSSRLLRATAGFAALCAFAVVSSLAILIPGDSAKGAYNSTLTFTTAPPAA